MKAIVSSYTATASPNTKIDFDDHRNDG